MDGSRLDRSPARSALTLRCVPVRAAGMLVGGLAFAVVACGGGEKEASRTETAAPSGQVATAVPASGEQLYQRCATCHQLNGQGMPGTFPPLVGSEYANARNVAVPIRILLHGIEGPIMVKGTQFSGVMPPYGTGVQMSDEEVASVLTYVRSSWGNSASAVTPQDVANERSAPRARTGAVTAEELKSLM